MILDKEEHRTFILDMLSKIQLPGQALDFAFEFKLAVLEAKVEPNAKFILLAECIRSGQLSESQIAEHMKDEAFAAWYKNHPGGDGAAQA